MSLLLSFIYVLVNVLQYITLPLFISTFTTTNCNNIETGPYFILVLMSFLFMIIFGISSLIDFYYKKLTYLMMKKYIYYLFLIGFCNALSGILIVFTSSLTKTNGYLQAILMQLTIPATFIFSKLLIKNSITTNHILSILILSIGIIIGFIPNYSKIYQNNYIYPLLFGLSCIPISLMSVLQNKIYSSDKDYNIAWILFSESFWQFITILLLFWTDLIPEFGTSNSFTVFFNNFEFGFSCFFSPVSGIQGKCIYCPFIGILFCISYCTTYYLQSILIKNISANYICILNALISPISMILWFIFKDLTIWGCGTVYSKNQIIYGLISIPFIFIGSYLYYSVKNHEEYTKLTFSTESDESVNIKYTYSTLDENFFGHV